MSTHTTVTIVGAGQAGLAMSRTLTDRGIDHVVLERGRIAERWRTERWDSLRLLTPNWMSRLPDWHYRGDDPEGFMTMPEVTRYLADYAASFAAPVLDETTVFSARRDDTGFVLDTSRGRIRSRMLVAATGAAATPRIPAIAGALPAHVHQTTPKHYKRPDQLPDGRVLVVGAAASGVQLADEIHASGRPVTIAVGAHTRLPRTYRGFDIQLWLDLMGSLDRRWDTMPDLDEARRAPSLQLVGRDDRADLDLEVLRRRGVELAGRLVGVAGSTLEFADDLAATCGRADAANRRLLDRMDRWAVETGLAAEIDEPYRTVAVDTRHPVTTATTGPGAITSIVWATGYRPDFSWIDPGMLRPDGAIDHDGGVATRVPGLYVLGLPFLRTRRSTYLDGVGADATALGAHLAARLDRTPVSA